MGPSAVLRPEAKAWSSVSHLVTDSLQSSSVQKVRAFSSLVDLQVNLILYKKPFAHPVAKLLEIQMLKAS